MSDSLSRKGKTRAQITAEVRERERRAVDLVMRGHDYGYIADELGYADESSARTAVKRALARRADPEVDNLREMESQRLLELMRRCYVELERDHVVVQWGKVVIDERTHEPVHDTAAVIATIRELRQLSAEFSKLRGLHAPLRTIVEEITEDAVQAEIRRINELADRAEADLPPEDRAQIHTEPE